MGCTVTAISYAIVGHKERAHQAHGLSARLGGARIALDDGTYGQGINHDRAWNLAAEADSDWCVVLEDDAQPVDDFLSQVPLVLDAAPAPIVSLYLGTSRPPQYQLAIREALTHNTCFITSNQLLHHVAVAIRTHLVPDMLTTVGSASTPADYRIGAWAQHRGHPIVYTHPSQVDHADGPTLIQHADGKPRTQPRRAWSVGCRNQWTSETAPLEMP